MTLEDKLAVTRIKAEKILKDNNLEDWVIVFTRERRKLAHTRDWAKTIFLSKYMVALVDEDEFTGILLHEVAHAILGKGFGHGKEFQETYNKLDPTGRFAGRGSRIATFKYTYICDVCEVRVGGDIKKDYKCGLCLKKGIESSLRAEENELIIKEWASIP